MKQHSRVLCLSGYLSLSFFLRCLIICFYNSIARLDIGPDSEYLRQVGGGGESEAALAPLPRFFLPRDSTALTHSLTHRPTKQARPVPRPISDQESRVFRCQVGEAVCLACQM